MGQWRVLHCSLSSLFSFFYVERTKNEEKKRVEKKERKKNFDLFNACFGKKRRRKKANVMSTT